VPCWLCQSTSKPMSPTAGILAYRDKSFAHDLDPALGTSDIAFQQVIEIWGFSRALNWSPMYVRTSSSAAPSSATNSSRPSTIKSTSSALRLESRSFPPLPRYASSFVATKSAGVRQRMMRLSASGQSIAVSIPFHTNDDTIRGHIGYLGQYGSLIAINSGRDVCICSPLTNPPQGGTLFRVWTRAFANTLLSPPSTTFLTDQARRSAAWSGNSRLSELNSGGAPRSCTFSGSSACFSTSHRPTASRPNRPRNLPTTVQVGPYDWASCGKRRRRVTLAVPYAYMDLGRRPVSP
jgi:hypothetical protein